MLGYRAVNLHYKQTGVTTVEHRWEDKQTPTYDIRWHKMKKNSVPFEKDMHLC